ncbi:MAG: hypothetical protein JWN71_2780 [Xanthobacteraceae bacterium]|nr:hypothetical protein [Xanthobacteraceae bacterium]
MQYTPIRSYRFYDMACFDPVTAVTVGLSAASTAVSAAGTLAGGDAAMASAQRQQQQAEFKAKQEEQAAQQARALAQRAALDKRQEGVMAASRAQAMFAHSGGGAADPTVLNVTGRLSAATKSTRWQRCSRASPKRVSELGAAAGGQIVAGLLSPESFVGWGVKGASWGVRAMKAALQQGGIAGAADLGAQCNA